MKLKAIKYIRYSGKPVQPGDVFECNEADVRVLLAIGTAERYVEPPKKVPAVFKPIAATRTEAVAIAQHALSPVVEPALEDVAEDKPKRGYKRRDMQAE